MLIRNCAGGVVFKDGKALILKNEKGEWVLPKGKIRENKLATETAVERVKYETGVDANIISAAGDTAYEFFSITREKPVCNKITWFIMEANDLDYEINEDEGFTEGGFYPVEKAIDMITYSQDKSLLKLSKEKYIECKEYEKKLEASK